MSTDPRRRRSAPRRARAALALTALALAATALTAGCASSSGAAADPAPGAGSSSSSGASASSTGYPTQDVVSSIAVDPTLHAELPASVASSGTLNLGTTLSPGTSGLPHVGTAANGQTVGLDVDLRNAVAKLLGVTWTVQNGTFATIIPGVQNGRFDVGQDNFGVTKAREQVVDFSTYLTDGQSFLASSSSSLTSVTAVTDLCGLTIATGAGTTFQQILTVDAPKCAAAGKKPYTVDYFADTAPIFLGLANGKVDVYFGPTLGLKYDAAHIAGTKFLGQFSSTPVGFVTAKGSPLAKVLSDAVNQLIANGDYARILAKWGVASSAVPASQVNPAPTL